MKEKKRKKLKMKKEKTIKVIRKLIKKLFNLIIILCIIYNIIFVLHKTVSQKEYMQVFGICAFRMETKSMQGDIEKNDLVITKKIKTKNLQEGDIIAYQINGKTRINKIISNQNGKITTKSNKNYNPDIETITEEQIIGKKIIALPIIGMLLKVIQAIITTLIILLFLIFKLLHNNYIQNKKHERARKRNFVTENKNNY